MGLRTLARLRAPMLVLAVALLSVATVGTGLATASSRSHRELRSVHPLSSLTAAAAGPNLANSARHLPMAAGHLAAVRSVGARIPWLSRRDSNTFRAADGRLASKIYPFPVNYRDRTGRFAAIDPSLVSRDGSVRQRANNLGLRLPTSADGFVSLGHRATQLHLRLLGANGAGRVAGRSEAFGQALGGVDLAYESANTGFGYQAKLSRAAAARGLKWLVKGSKELTAHVTSVGVVFRNRHGRVVWALGTPTARLSTGRTLPLALSLSRRGGDVVITVHNAYPNKSGRQGSDSSDVLGAPVGPGGITAGYPAWESGWIFEGGIIYNDQPGTGSSNILSGSCDLKKGSPTTSYCNQSTDSVGLNDRTLLNFNVGANLPDHVQVLDAFAAMHINSESNSSAMTIGAWASDEPWTNLATWNTYNGTTAWPTAGGDLNGTPSDEQTAGTGSDVGQWLFWDVDSAMQGWLDGTSANDGVEFAQTSSVNNTVAFDGATSASYYPYVFVYYEPRIGNYPGAKYDTQQLTTRSSMGVNVASGNLELSNQDLNLTGVNGLNLQVQRTYNDLSSDEGSFGVGWTMSGADTYIAIPSDERNTFIFADGSGDMETYYQDVNGNWVYPLGNDAQITMNTASTATATQYQLYFRHSGITETFNTPPGVTNPNGYLARLTSVTDRNGNTITYSYAYPSGKPAQLTTITDSFGNKTTITYSSAGYISQIKDPTGRIYAYNQNSSGELTSYEDPAGNYTYYTYDSYGNLTQIKTPAGRIINVAYDAGHSNRVTSITRLVKATDSTGPTTSYQYATASGTCQTANQGASVAGWIQTTASDPKSHVTTFCTDGLGRIESVVDANGNTQASSYTSDGNLSSETNPAGTVTGFTYAQNSTDNLTQIQEGSGSSSLSESFAYTGTGNNSYLPSAETDAQGNSTSLGYNSTGNQTSMSTGSSSQYQSSIAYNPNGTVKTSTDADGNVTTYGYGANGAPAGDLTSVTPPAGSGLNTTTLTYDTANRVKTISTIAGGTGHSVTYTYNVFDQPTQVVYKSASGTTTTIGYTYDNDGHLIKRTQASGNTVYTYDGLGRLTNESFPDGSTDVYGYDAASNLITLKDAGGTVTYGYDNANRLTSVTDPGASTATQLGYNANGSLTSITYPSGAGVAYTYNAEGQLTNVADTYKTSGGTTAQLSFTNSYVNPTTGLATDLVQSTTNQVGNITNYTYDALNRLTQAVTTNGMSTLSSYTYTLDGDGNVLQALVSGSAVTASATTAAYNSGNETCWYVLAATSSGSCSQPPAGAYQPTYDGDGELTADGGGFTASYNALGQMTSATPSGGTATSYSYNGEGQQEIATEGSATLHNDILGLASHSDPTSGVDYFTRTTQGQQLSLRTPSATYNYLYDGEGDPVALTNASGQIVDRYSYDPYGGRTASGPVPSYFGFQGGYENASGLLHFGARYLSSQDLRWTQQDPLSQVESFSEGDRYGFAGDDPVNASDPGGEISGATLCVLVTNAFGALCGPGSAPVQPFLPQPVQLVMSAVDHLADAGGEVAKAVEGETEDAGDGLIEETYQVASFIADLPLP